MRPICRPVIDFWPEVSDHVKVIVNASLIKYKRRSGHLGTFPQILEGLAEDFAVLSTDKTGQGRNADLTA